MAMPTTIGCHIGIVPVVGADGDADDDCHLVVTATVLEAPPMHGVPARALELAQA